MSDRKKGFLKVDEDYLNDPRRRQLSPAQREVLLHMGLHSWRGNDANGIHVDGEVLVTPQQLVELTGYKQSAIYEALNRIVAVGLAARKGRTIVLSRTGAAVEVAREDGQSTGQSSARTEDISGRMETGSGRPENREPELAPGCPPDPPGGLFGEASEYVRVSGNFNEDFRWIHVDDTKSGQRVFARSGGPA